MSATNEVLKYFTTNLEKKNVEILMSMIFPKDGEIVESGRVKGEVGRSGWKVAPEAWWIIKCNKTNKCYHIKFKVKETAMGDIKYFYNGTGFQNFSFIKDENILKDAIGEFIQSKLNTLIY